MSAARFFARFGKMSRIGKIPVQIPKGVTVTIDGSTVKVKGSKGSLEHGILFGTLAKIEDNKVIVEKTNETPQAKMNYGTMRAHIANMIKGVTEGYQKTLLIEGVGYRASVEKNEVVLNLGFAEPKRYKIPNGIKVETPEQSKIVISGIEIEKVGQTAMELRAFRKPEPYKGKGVRYEFEHIRRKAGKAAGK